MSALPNVLLQSDPDTTETQEWLDALEAVMAAEGPERAHFLLEKLIESARTRLAGSVPLFPAFEPDVSTTNKTLIGKEVVASCAVQDS